MFVTADWGSNYKREGRRWSRRSHMLTWGRTKSFLALTSLFWGLFFQQCCPVSHFHLLLADVWTHGFNKHPNFNNILQTSRHLKPFLDYKTWQEGNELCLTPETSSPLDHCRRWLVQLRKLPLKYIYLIFSSAREKQSCLSVCVCQFFLVFLFFMSRLLKGPHGSVTHWFPLPGESFWTLCQLKPDVSWTPSCIFSMHVMQRKERWQSLWSECIFYQPSQRL